MENLETRVCNRCGIEKDVRDFPKYLHFIISTCRKCRNEMDTIRRKNLTPEKRQKRRDRVNKRIRERLKNDEQYRISRKQTRERRKEKFNEWMREYRKNPDVKIEMACRRRMHKAIKLQYAEKSYKTIEMIGCSIEECRKWLESKFEDGMSWDNYGKEWHIDHILPCVLFDLKNPDEQKKCFNYTNLQPLWKNDNLSKHDKVEVYTSEGVFWV